MWGSGPDVTAWRDAAWRDVGGGFPGTGALSSHRAQDEAELDSGDEGQQWSVQTEVLMHLNASSHHQRGGSPQPKATSSDPTAVGESQVAGAGGTSESAQATFSFTSKALGAQQGDCPSPWQGQDPCQAICLGHKNLAAVGKCTRTCFMR